MVNLLKIIENPARFYYNVYGDVMKNEEISYNTKRKLSTALKELMKQKDLSKISVSELVKKANLNRKTFYYHFQDINELLKWTIEEEAVHVINNFEKSDDYKEALLFLMDYIESNDDILMCAYDSIGREGFKKFFYDDLYEIVKKLVYSIESELNHVITNDFRNFLIRMYTGAALNMIFDYLGEPKNIKHEKTVHYLDLVIKSSIKASITAFSEDKTNYIL